MGLFDFFKKKEEVQTETRTYRPPLASSSPTAKPLDMRGSTVMSVEDIFPISGRGIVVAGNISKGNFTVGDIVTILHRNGTFFSTTISAIEKSRKGVETVQAGENASLLLQGVTPGQMRRGDVVKKM